jgi:hypothetical protein
MVKKNDDQEIQLFDELFLWKSEYKAQFEKDQQSF